MRAGVIDIGSNSTKLIIGEKVDDGLKVLESLKNIIPIGISTFLKGFIAQETINQIITILLNYKKALQEYDVTQVSVIATTAVREARNQDVFLDTVLRKTGFKIEVLSVGDVVYYIDAYISHKLKDTYPIHSKNLIIVEVGSGSVDISVLRKGFTMLNVGLAIGTLRLKQVMAQLDGSQEEIRGAIQEYIENEFFYLKRILPRVPIDDIILIDENYSSLQNLLPHKKHDSDFFQFRLEDAQALLKQFEDNSLEDMAKTHKIPLEVVDTMVGYANVLNMFFTLTQNKYIYILESSLTEAILANTLLNFELSEKYNKKNQLIAVATYICLKYDIDLEHAQHVAKLSKILFEKLKDYLGLNEEDSLYLILAAYLHDIGIFVNNRSHHKHSEYIISALNLFRLTDEELKVVACVARYHRQAPPMKSHMLYHSLPLQKQILVQKLSALLRIANSLDSSHKQKIKKIDIKFNKQQDLSLVVYTKDNLLLERADFQERKELFEQITGNKINLVAKGESP